VRDAKLRLFSEKQVDADRLPRALISMHDAVHSCAMTGSCTVRSPCGRSPRTCAPCWTSPRSRSRRRWCESTLADLLQPLALDLCAACMLMTQVGIWWAQQRPMRHHASILRMAPIPAFASQDALGNPISIDDSAETLSRMLDAKAVVVKGEKPQLQVSLLAWHDGFVRCRGIPMTCLAVLAVACSWT